MKYLCILLLLWLTMPTAQAHKPSDSYLTLAVNGSSINGRWDIALRDLDGPLLLDGDGNGELTWGEVRAREAEIQRYAFEHLHLAAASQPCPISPGQLLIDQHSDGTYAVLPFTAQCTSTPQRLKVDYRLFRDTDTLHKGLIHLAEGGQNATAIVGLEHPTAEIDVRGRSAWQALRDFAVEGIWHIWRGFDHALFLLCLILPAAYWPEQRRWQPVASMQPVLLDMLKTVTGFTAAHALSLTLASLHLLTVPSQWVEVGIALTILLTALNNLYPVLPGRKWLVAFGFGLIHGLGFANILADMALPTWQLVVALTGFNIGVELGQLIMVTLVLPVLLIYRRGVWFKWLVLYGGSLLIAGFAVIWIYERSTGLKLLGL
ncbi:HupE / UreJ protein [Andreprevotia lacus DSM 23236]|jgi:hypothetical protein|uniref:HupE / UreJ protein n=1 Tax=Andreprevotia lacus DSM 23236 TaxID=1121001 RepID=A0A1W1Y145_9NEIS|nr:HupE/UreJ family protein [Andreprevotia lacus]SMC29857.1 HupE / UreJ protein [Andreprevotia lacus DSM 23236]